VQKKVMAHFEKELIVIIQLATLNQDIVEVWETIVIN